MKNNRCKKRWLILSFILLCIGCSGGLYAKNTDHLKNVFTNPPVDARPGVYWYWMNGNISREGIREDLTAMNEIGIKWVYIMDIGLLPEGKVENRSSQWYEMMRTALGEIKKYGIKAHVASPGWAVTGGPWVTPELSMKEIVWRETLVDGGRKVSVRLPQPATTRGFYRDIAVLAFPVRRGDAWGSMSDLKPVVKDLSGNRIAGAEAMFDGSYETKAELPNRFEIFLDTEREVRSVMLRAGRHNGYFEATLEGWDKNTGVFVKLGTLRGNNAGPFSAQIGDATFPAIKSDRFRITMSSPRAIIEELELYGSVRMPNWINKAGFGTHDITVAASEQALYPQAGDSDIISTSEIMDISNRINADGLLEWDAPKGQWVVQRIGYTSTGIEISPAPVGGAGLEIDKMSKQATDYHYHHAVGKLLEELGPELAPYVTFHHIDSYEAGWQNWTKGFDREFYDRRGYNIIQWFPAMTGRIIGSPEATDKFCWDLRNVISDLFTENHYSRMAEDGRKDGLLFSNEPYGGPFNNLHIGSVADLPMAEFWMPSTQPKERKIDFPGVFAGRTNNRKVIASETYTSESPAERWNYYPYNLKATGDYIYCCGVNRFIMHVSAHQSFTGDHMRPGLTCGINGIHYDRGNTWWYNGGKAWNEYISRCQSLLQEGKHVADVLYFQGCEAPSEARWFDPKLPVGYDYDACSEEVFLTLDVREGRVVLPSGKSYRYVVLPSHGWMTTASVLKASEIAEKGGTVIGKPTIETPSLSDIIHSDVERKKAYLSLWGNGTEPSAIVRIGRGRIIWGKQFEDILAMDKLLPDFSYDKESGLLLNYIHRSTQHEEIYFVANGYYKGGTVKCRFRMPDGMVPEFWNTDTGLTEKCLFYMRDKGFVEIPIKFDPAGSVFVVFRKGENKEKHIVALTLNGKDIDVHKASGSRTQLLPATHPNVWNDFTVSFWCKPETSISLPQQTNQGVYWGGQNWAFFPSPAHILYGPGNSGMGVSVGRNGVAIFEHWDGNVPPVLVYRFPRPVSDWYHVTVTYDKGVPSLYIDGKFIAEGLKSGRRVHPSTYDNNEDNRSLLGLIANIGESSQTLTPEAVAQLFSKLSAPTVTGPDNSLPSILRGNNGSYIFDFMKDGTYNLNFSSGETRNIEIKDIPTPLDISAGWTVEFPAGWGAPEKISLGKLVSLSEHENEGVKYFSGTATYRKNFNLSDELLHNGNILTLDLGEVDVVAKIILNGHDLGIFWKAPFACDVTGIVKATGNELEVKVTNLWANRMIGDEQFPSDIRYNEDNGIIIEWPEWMKNGTPRPEQRRLTFSTLRAWNKEDIPPPSGLVGPVRLISSHREKLR